MPKDSWGSVITDDEVDALLRAHGEIDYTHTPDGLDDAIHASEALRNDHNGRIGRLKKHSTWMVMILIWSY